MFKDYNTRFFYLNIETFDFFYAKTHEYKLRDVTRINLSVKLIH